MIRLLVRDFFDDYISLLDAEEFDSWLKLFEPDATYEVQSRENFDQGMTLATIRADSRSMLTDRVIALRETQFFAPRIMRHLVSGVRVTHEDGHMVDAQASFLVAESIEGEHTRVQMSGEYRTRLARNDDALQVQRMTAIYDSALIDTSLIYPL